MNKITVIGLGAGDLEQMPLGVYKKIKTASRLFLRTKHHPVIKELEEEEGFIYESFDHVYEANQDFHSVYRTIVDTLFQEAKKEHITYAVPGHPFIAEQTVQYLVQEASEQGVQLHFAGGQSFLDAMYQALQIDPIEGCQIVDGTALRKDVLQPEQHMIICQVYDAFVASEVKLTLMEILPDDYMVTIATAVGTASEQLSTVPLYELDRSTSLNNLTAVYVPPVKEEALLYRQFSSLRKVIAMLRGPDGCPWDKKQTHASLKPFLIEEAYEVLEAIDEEDDTHLIEELGDVLLQVMLHSQIGEDNGFFTVEDVIESTTKKMIRRHPHVFADAQAKDAEEVVQNWEEIKQQEKEKPASFLEGIPKGLPSLLRAFELQKKAAKVGFDWDDAAPMWMKLQEELAEFFTELKQKDQEKMSKEFGDILFVLVNLGRFYQINPEEALQRTNQKFYQRFGYIEQTLKETGRTFSECTLAELDEIWEKSKEQERRK